VLGVPAPGQVRIPATLRVSCYVTPGNDGLVRCMFPGPQQPQPIAADSTLTLQAPKGWINYQISDVHVVTDPPVSRSRVAFVVTPVIAEKMKVGDQDASPKVTAQKHSARIVALEQPHGAGDNLTIIATLDVPVDQELRGWSYKQAPFKIGAPFSFETSDYMVQGVVRDMARPQAAQPSEGSR